MSIRNPRWPLPLGMGTYGENILKLFFILNRKTIGWQTWLECSLDGSSHNAFLFPSEFQDDSADHDLKQTFNHSLPKKTSCFLSGGHIILVDSFLMVKYMYIKFIENTEHCIICIKHFQYLIQFVGYSLNHCCQLFSLTF